MAPKRRLFEEIEAEAEDEHDVDRLTDEAVEAELIEVGPDDEDEAEEGWD